MRQNYGNMGIFLNKQGILFTAMLLLVILSMLSLINVIEQGKKASDEKELIALEEIDFLYENIYGNIVSLDKSGKNKEVMERMLPFSYSLEDNVLRIEQMLPLLQSQQDNFFNIVNSFEIFLEDGNYANEFNSLKTDINVVKNAMWGGSALDLNFLINPFCVMFSEGINMFAFLGSNNEKCSQVFDSKNIQRIDLNIEVLRASEDFNAIKCNGGSCPQQPFTPGNPKPYYRIEILDANCTNCNLSQKIVSKHLDPETEDMNVFIYCDNSICNSEAITIIVGKDIKVRNTGKQVKVNVQYAFKEEIEDFIFDGFDYSIENNALKAKKSNR